MGVTDTIAGTVYSESGGTYKTTTTANTAVSLVRGGLDVLCIDLDPQEGNLTSLFDVGDNRDDHDADNIVKHILESPDGPFEDLIETSDEGVDVIPSHGQLGDFTSLLERKQNAEVGLNYDTRKDFPRNKLLYKLLWEEVGVQEDYDAVLIDPNARAEANLYNAIFATRTIIAPVKPAGKGKRSLDGLDDLVGNMTRALDIEVGLAAVVPSAVSTTNAHQRYTEKFKAEDYPTPVAISDRESMMDDMWEAEGSAFHVLEHGWKTYEDPETGSMVSNPGKRRVVDREIETVEKFYELAYFIATETFGVEMDPELRLDIREYEEGEPVGIKETITHNAQDPPIPEAGD